MGRVVAQFARVPTDTERIDGEIRVLELALVLAEGLDIPAAPALVALGALALFERGVERAWQDIRAAISTVEVDPEQWEAGYFSLFTDAQAFAGFMA